MRELTDLELDILMILADNKGHALWELVELLGKEKSNLIITLNRLEEEIELTDPFNISHNDIINPAHLKTKFHEPKDLLSQYIREQFCQDTIRILDSDRTSLDCPPQSRPHSELNKLLDDSNLFEENRFAHVPLNDEIRELISNKPQGRDLRYLNRLLLEAAYPEGIIRVEIPSYAKEHQEKQPTPNQNNEGTMKSHIS